MNDDGNYDWPAWTTPNLAAQLLAQGYSFGGYSENLPSVGYTGSTWSDNPALNEYVEKHNPWVNWQGTGPNQIPATCNMPYTSCPIYSSGNSATYDYSSLPAVSYIVPNEQNEMHDGTLQQGDQWLQNNMNGYIQWAKTHNSLLIFTFDEDDSGGGTSQGRSPRSSSAQGVVPGVYNESANCFSLLRTFEDRSACPTRGGGHGRSHHRHFRHFRQRGSRCSGSGHDHLATQQWQRQLERRGNWVQPPNIPTATPTKSRSTWHPRRPPLPPFGEHQYRVADARCEYLSFDQSGAPPPTIRFPASIR